MLEAKLRPPLARPEWVTRNRLIEELEQASQRPVTLIAAPAGYGKSTAVTQWLASPSSPANIAWVSLESSDNDPVRLWTHIATALDRAGCVIARDIAGFIAAGSHDMLAAVLPKIITGMAELPTGVTLLIDDFHIVRSAACIAQIDFLIKHLPEQARLVLITRADPTLRLGRLRAAGQLSEIRADDLAFDVREASALLTSDGFRLSTDSMWELMRRTEGWPAGLYLAALSLIGRADPDQFIHHFSGNNRFIGDYLTEEVLSRQSDEVRSFILDMSVVRRFSTELCDHMTGARQSARIIRDLQHTNLFLIPLDTEGRWFRFHHLFGAVALGALEAEQPSRIAMLHNRAAEWMSEHGYVDDAFEHALAAGESHRAAELVQMNWLQYVDSGLGSTVRSWIRELKSSAAGDDVNTLVTAAWMAALSGEVEEMSQLLKQLDNVGNGGVLPDGTRSVESAVALIRGIFGFGGPVDMLAAARLAVVLETDGNALWYGAANTALGHANYVAGDLTTAVELLLRGAHTEKAPAIIRVLAFSILALTYAELRDPDRSRRAAQQAMNIVDAGSMHALPHIAFAFTALGQSQAAYGNLAEAMATLDYGLALRRKVPGLSPWPTMHHLLVMGRVAIITGDLPLARQLLDEAAVMIRRYPHGMAAMAARLDGARKGLRENQNGERRIEHLTARELDILRMLTTSQSLSQIAAELYLSPNTVKTHTMSLYRKLGVRSRSEAVKIGRERLVI